MKIGSVELNTRLALAPMAGVTDLAFRTVCRELSGCYTVSEMVSAKALCGMKHRKDEIRTGTYVTIQAFQQGIGTGACGPNIMPEFQFSAKQDYTLKFLIRVEAEK